jgi:hypothetical protein
MRGTIERLRKMIGGERAVSAIAITLSLCILLFLVADSLNIHFPGWKILFEPVKDLCLAAIAALTVVLVDHFVTIRKVAAELTAQMQVSITSMMEQFIFGGTRAGLVAFHEKLNFSRLFEELAPGEELLWLDTYCPRTLEFIEEIRPALERGAKLRMLIIDPECQNAISRAEELGKAYEPGTFSQETFVFTKRINSTVSIHDTCKLGESCRVLVYEDLPCMPMYIITRDGIPYRGYSGFFLTKPSAYFVHLEWALTKGGVLEELHKYFEQKWKNQDEKPKQTFTKPQKDSARAELGEDAHGSHQRKIRDIKRA